jgi:hypothetical protein
MLCLSPKLDRQLSLRQVRPAAATAQPRLALLQQTKD